MNAAPRNAASRRSSGSLALVIVAVVVVAAAACGLYAFRDRVPGWGGGTQASSGALKPAIVPTTTAPTGPEDVGRAYLAAWQAGDYAAMQKLVADPTDDMNRVYGGMAQRLHLTAVAVSPGQYDPITMSLPFSVTLTLRDLGQVSYSTTLHLTREIPVTSTSADPSNGSATDGSAEATTATVGGDGAENTDPSATGGQGPARVDFSSDTVYPGLVRGQRLDLLVGTKGRAEVLDRHGLPLSGDDDLKGSIAGVLNPDGTGKTGLERIYDTQLRGKDESILAVVHTADRSVVNEIQRWPGTLGTPVRTTLDLRMQRAAERALAGVTVPAALVAIDVPTGQLRVAANVHGGGLPPALIRTMAPGSTFKIITSTAAFAHGATPSSQVTCSQTLTVHGKVFHNYEAAPSQTMSVTKAFAMSCNTAFISLASSLPDGALSDAAAVYGFDTGSSQNPTKPLPVGSAAGSMPAPQTATEAAADAIGQGRVEASPLEMASVAAGVASGTWHQPRILADCPDCVEHPVPNAESLRALMRAVVTSGTGTRVAHLAGGPVYAKTGTAEFGSGDSAHCWFVGWQGSVAFAVYVETGKSGGTAAAPVAASFLTAVNSSAVS